MLVVEPRDLGCARETEAKNAQGVGADLAALVGLDRAGTIEWWARLGRQGVATDEKDRGRDAAVRDKARAKEYAEVAEQVGGSVAWHGAALVLARGMDADQEAVERAVIAGYEKVGSRFDVAVTTTRPTVGVAQISDRAFVLAAVVRCGT